MLKLALVIVVSSLLVSCFGKPLDETNNEKLADTKNISENAGRTGLSENAKSFEADSSTTPLESAKAENGRSGATDAKPVNDADEKRTGEADTKATDESRKDATHSVAHINEADNSKTAKTEAIDGKGESRAAKTETSNAAEEKRTGKTEKVKFDENRNAKLAEEKHHKRETNTKNLEDVSERVGHEAQEDTQRLLTDISLGAAVSSSEESKKANSNLENLEPDLNLEVTVSTRAGNSQEQGATLQEQERSGTEVNVEVESSQLDGDRVGTVASTKAVSTPDLRSGKEDTVAAEKSERSGLPENLDDTDANTRLNREDSVSKSADKELETADADVKSGTPAEAAESKSADPASSAADDKAGTELIESRSGHTHASANVETAADARTSEKANVHEEVQTKRMLSDEPNHEAEHGRSGLDVTAASEVSKDVVSLAGSPAEQSRLASPLQTTFGFPTTIPIPMRRSINKNPSIIITKIPESDIITLPHQVGVSPSFLHPRQAPSRNLERSNEADVSGNGYEYNGDERSGGSSANSEPEVSVDEQPEKLLRVDDYGGDVSNYNLRSHIGSPAANPEVRNSELYKPVSSRNLASESPASEHSRKSNDELRLDEKSPRKSVEEFEESRSAKASALLESRFQPRPPHSDLILSRRPTDLGPRFPNLQRDSFFPNQHHLPEVESSLKIDSLWPKPLVNRLIQATTLATVPHYPQQNLFGHIFPSAYYPSAPRYY